MVNSFANPTAFEAALLAAGRMLARSQRQSAALDNFEKTGFPHRRLEGWKWTDLRAALRNDVGFASPANDVIAPSIFSGLGAYEVTLMNGAAEWSGDLPKGVSITKSSADRALPKTVLNHPLAELALAMAGDIIEINVADGVFVERPILIRHIAGGGAAHPRIAIKVGSRARLTFIESFDGVGEYFWNGLTELSLEFGANANRIVLQNGSDEGVVASICGASLAEKADFHQSALLLGARLSRLETNLSHDGGGARAALKSAAILGGGRHADLTSRIEHNAPGCVTQQLHKSAVAGRGRGVFQGKFFVARGAQKTQAQMAANALLLSEMAEVNQKPELEIYADDVECAHGSTVGALNEEALFYLQSRGLDDAAARAMLVDAFLGEVFDDMPHPAIEHVFRMRAARSLEGLA